MRKKLTLCLFALSTVGMFAQSIGDKDSKWYVGAGGGIYFGNMSFSNLDKDVFPKEKGLTSGVFSVFAERNFGANGNYGIRPEITFLNRGGKLTDIYSTKAFEDFYEAEGISNISYKLKAHYLDLRIPVFYQLGTYDSKIRPYVYAAPILGFATGGHISVEQQNVSGAYYGYALDANKANLSSTYFAAAVGLGAKWNVNVEGQDIYLALDINYEFGLSNTYGTKEKNGEAIVQQNLFYNTYKIDGSRKFSGFGIKASIGIPIGKKKVANHVVAPPVKEVYTPIPTPVEEQEKPCYSLEEISDMLKAGKDVFGKVFCAVDAIQFELGKSNIKNTSFAYLNELADILKETGMRVEVKGHTDNSGSEEVNMKLSRKRAEAVVNYLIKQGVDKTKLSYSYYGMSSPLTDNDTEEGRRLNRRVEFEILK